MDYATVNRLVLVLIISTALILGVGEIIISPVAAAETGKIAYTSNWEIWVMNPNGTGQTRLTNNDASDSSPAWSPDGSRIAFDSNRIGYGDIYVMNADGTGQARLTTNTSPDGSPAWSPDGSRIAFVSSRDGSNDIYVMNSDGSGQSRRTYNLYDEGYPAWSPDSSRIAFMSSRDGNCEIYIMDADGTDQTRVTSNAAMDWMPAWSPDGSHIVFSSDRDGNYEIYAMKTDGTEQTRLTTNAVPDYSPTWSPNGSRIAYASGQNDNAEIYVMNTEGTGQIRLTTNTVSDHQPAWWGAVTPTPTPTGPTPYKHVTVPGTLEAEDYDRGGEGIAYHDTTPGNSGAVCRTAEAVDIVALPGGGNAVGGVENGEWLTYTIDGITDAANGGSSYPYPVEFYVASDRDGRSIQVEVDGRIDRNLSVPNTGSLQTITPVLTQFWLEADWLPVRGQHTIRLLFHGDGQSLDKIVLWKRQPLMYADGWSVANFTTDKTEGPAPLTVHFTDTSPGGQYIYGWHWDFGNSNGSTEKNPVWTYDQPGVYTVSFYVEEEDYWSKIQIGSQTGFSWFHHLYQPQIKTMRVTVSAPSTPTPTPPVVVPTMIGYETPIVARAADQLDPAIHDSRIVWQDWRNDGWYEGKITAQSRGDVYSYNLTTHIEQPEGASASMYGKYGAHDDDSVISDSGIFWVWSGRSDADVNNEIQGQTLQGELISVTLVGEPGQRYIRDLAIDGNRLVYVVYEGDTNFRVILYDTATRHVYTIRQSGNDIRSPDISGDTIVWQEYNGYSWDMYRYNLMQGAIQTFAYGVGDRASLAIDGTSIVWSAERNGEYNLYAWNLAQPYPSDTAWIEAPGDQTNPQISGDRVVWQDNRGGNWDIYSASLSSGTVATICTATGNQEAPFIEGNRVVWQDDRNGNWDIYMFTISSTTPAPVPTPAPFIITSPGTYSITADGYDGRVTPIEIRSSNVVLDGGGHTIDGSDQPGSCGIRIVGNGASLSNVVVRNIRLSNWETGIYADRISGSVIETSDIDHNSQGIILEDAQSVQIRNNHINANDVRGVTVKDSGNVIVQGNEIRKTGDGFTVYYYGGGFEDVYIHAVYVTGSSGTEVSDNDLGGNHASLYLTNAPSTRVMGNRLTGAKCGILAFSAGAGTIVANNLFRNAGHDIYGNFPGTAWNVTPSPGPNIVNGPRIGGNFWANLDGTGFSETHSDTNGDGFCDQAYDNGWNGIDQLPLALWSGPSISTVPGSAGTPTDTNADGKYDDVNGNGRADFADVVLYFNQMSWIAENEPVGAFDYNGNGRIDFADVVWLFNHI